MITHAHFALLVSLLVTLISGATAPAAIVDIREHGAKPDAKTLCTTSIQSAIDQVAEDGGGTVHFAPGTWLTGTLRLKSHVTLQLDAGCVLLGSTNPADYPEHRPATRSYTDNYVCQSLLTGEKLANIAIRGRGTIDGNGAAFHWKEYGNRPYLIRLVGCRDVLVEGVHLRNSAMWMQHYLACDYVRIQNVTVWNHVSYNNDGLDIDGCRHVVVSGCRLDSDDDALCFKSTLGRACEDITVANCVLSSHCNAIKMGTESNGGFRNIAISNCAISSPRYSKSAYGTQAGLAGIALETVDGGHLDGVTLSNITIRGVKVPIFMRLGNRARPFTKGMPKPDVGTFHHVSLSNIVATGAAPIGCSLTGLPDHPIEDVSLSDISLTFAGGGTAQQAERAVPELAANYPESGMFGVLPAYGFYCRHAEGLVLRNVRLRAARPELRPAVVLDDVTNVVIDGLNAAGNPDSRAVVRLVHARGALLRGCRLTEPAGIFLEIEGTRSRDIFMTGNDVHDAAQLAVFHGAATKESLTQVANRMPGE